MVLKVTHRPFGYAHYADSDHFRSVKLSPSASFNKINLKRSSVKDLEGIDNAHNFDSMYKLTPSSKNSRDLSTGFQRSFETTEGELTNKKTN